MARRAAVLLLAVAACVRTDSVVCPGGDVVCPADTVCREVGGQTRCASPDDIRACDEGTCSGTRACHDGVCLPIECGNGLQDPDEDCDNGANLTGSGCSPLCKLEVCGNGTIDPTRLDADHVQQPNEQCDDGNLVGHDGCSLSCQVESLQWRSFAFANPAARMQAALAYDTSRRRFVLFGGHGESISATTPARLGDTYESETGDGWVLQAPPISPSPREAPAMAYDPIRKRAVLFGGSSGGALGDTWLWDGEAWTAEQPAHAPPPRFGHAMAFDPARGTIVLFGGDSGEKPLGDTWEWNGTDWAELPFMLPPRMYAAMAFDPVHGTLLLAGGRDGSGDTVAQTLALTAAGWTEVSGAATPADATDHALVFDPASQRMLLIVPDASRQVITYAWTGQQWQDTASAEAVPYRRSYAAATDPVAKHVVLFGGYNEIGLGGTVYDETWAWDGATWSKTKNAPVLVQRVYRAAAFDPLRRAYLTFGGLDQDGTPVAETWELRGTRWAQTGGSSVTPRAAAAMAYDPGHREVVLFGGTSSTTNASGLGDTWTFAGGVWTPHPVTPSPPGRYLAAMAYDPRSGHVVLFGGLADPLTPLQDTWEWDGAAWTEHTQGERPVPRYGATLVDDRALGRLLLFGGANGADLGDLWAWDGTGWTELTGMGFGPSARKLHGAVWDERRSAMVIAFGSSGTGGQAVTIPDLWELGGHGWQGLLTQSQPPERVAPLLLPALDGAGVVVFDGDAGESFATARGSFADFWRLRLDGPGSYEACVAGDDHDADGAAGCADPDCAALCDPLCPAGATGCDPARPRCGDGTCDDTRENCRNCPADCPCTAVCGDFACDPGEDHASCPGDCP